MQYFANLWCSQILTIKETQRMLWFSFAVLLSAVFDEVGLEKDSDIYG